MNRILSLSLFKQAVFLSITLLLYTAQFAMADPDQGEANPVKSVWWQHRWR